MKVTTLTGGAYYDEAGRKSKADRMHGGIPVPKKGDVLMFVPVISAEKLRRGIEHAKAGRYACGADPDCDGNGTEFPPNSGGFGVCKDHASGAKRTPTVEEVLARKKR